MDVSNDFSEPCENYKHKCPESGCNASYRKLSSLEVHKRKHSGEKPFVCDVEDCDRAYTNLAHLRRHKSYVHEKSDEVLCTVSGCGQVFSNKYSLRKHVNRMHNVNNMIKCAECNQEFKKKHELKKHLLSHKEGVLTCFPCNISFDSLHLYRKHKRNHKTYTCDCGLVFDKWTLFCAHRRNICEIKNIDHKCIICNKIFTTKRNLKTHTLTHIEESQKELYRCPYLDCKKNYKYKKNLNYHIAVYHERKNEEAKIKCTEQGCEMVFKTNKNLKQHIKNSHNKMSNKKKERRPRKDKGKRKKCMAAVLSGVALPAREHLSLLNNSNSTEHDKLPDNESEKTTDGEDSCDTSEQIIFPGNDTLHESNGEKYNSLQLGEVLCV